MKIFGKIIPILIQLSLLFSPILLLQSCGDESPFGSSITLEELTTSAVLDSGGTFKYRNFKVSVFDSDGNPMNGISVTISGGKAGINYGINDQVTASRTIKTNNWGYAIFQVQAPLTIDRQLLPPTTVTLTSNLTGTLLADTYCYQITAVDALGSTLPSTEECITLAVDGGVNLSWTTVANALSYDIYGRSTGVEGLLKNVVSPTVTTTDNDPAVSPGSSPPATNGTDIYSGQTNAFSDSLTAQSGAVSASLSISF